MVEPDSKDIINVSFVEQEVFLESRHDTSFVYRKEKVSVLASWGRAHNGTGELIPIRIAKLKNIICHDK